MGVLGLLLARHCALDLPTHGLVARLTRAIRFGASALKIRIERLREEACGLVIHVPKARDDRPTAREQERTRQRCDAFAAGHLSARGFACREHDKIRV